MSNVDTLENDPLNLENDPFVPIDMDAVRMVLGCFMVIAICLVGAAFITCGPAIALLVMSITCYPLYLFAASYVEESVS